MNTYTAVKAMYGLLVGALENDSNACLGLNLIKLA